MPQKSIIDGLKGTLDFYEIHLNPTIAKGIPVCRSWPRYDPEHRTPASIASALVFAYIAKAVMTLPDNLVQAYAELDGPNRLTWKDYAIRAYLNGDLIYPNSTTLDDWWHEDE